MQNIATYIKAGFAIATTVTAVPALANTAGYRPSSSRGSDAAPENTLENPHQLMSTQEAIMFADNSFPIQPRHAKRIIGSEFQINTFIGNEQTQPSVAGLATGDFVVVWQSLGLDSFGGIYGRLYSNTAVPQGGEFHINTYTQLSQARPSVAGLTTGDFVVVWDSDGQDGDSTGIYGQLFSSTAIQKGSEFQINTYTTKSQIFASVTALISGDFVVAWRGAYSGSSFVYVQLYSNTAVPKGSEFQINTYFPAHSGHPSVVGLTSGDFVATWSSDGEDGDGSGIYGQLFSTTGVPQGSEFRVNTYTIAHQAAPSVAGLDTGDFVVIWASNGQDGDSYGIYGQRYSSTGIPQGNEFQINTYTTNNQAFPTITPLISGDFVVAWASNGQDGSSYGIYGQRYSSTGTPQGSEFQINTYNALKQMSPAVAVLSTSDLVVVWQSEGQDSDGFGIYGRIYFAPVLVNNALTISEGEIVILNTINLNATDNNYSALMFTVSNIQHGQFERVTKINTAIATFTQQDIVDNVIRFVHDGGENKPTYDITVDNGLLTYGPAMADIIFIENNDAPSLISHPFVLQNGETSPITPKILNAIDSDNSNQELIFNIANINNGYFKTALVDTAITQFTMQQVIDKEIFFVSDGTNLPEYIIDVTDGAATSAAEASAIVYINKNKLVLKPSSITTLSSKQLNIQTQLTPMDLKISLINIRYSYFENSKEPGIAVFSFNLADLNSERITFMHLSKDQIPQFTLTFEDLITNYTLPRTIDANVTLNRPPVVLNPTGTLKWPLNKLSNYTVPTTLFSDPDRDRLQFSVKENNDNALPQWIQFNNTQNILVGTPTTTGLYGFKIIANDPYNATTEDRFYIDVRSNYGTENTNLLPIVVAIASGTALLVGCLAVGFFYNKKLQDRKTRNQHKFAQLIRHHLKFKDVDNFESADGQRFVQAVQSLSDKLLEEQGINLTNMSNNELSVLANEVAVAAKNKISPATTGMWKKSKISITEFEETVGAIAQDISRRRTTFEEGRDDDYIKLESLSTM